MFVCLLVALHYNYACRSNQPVIFIHPLTAPTPSNVWDHTPPPIRITPSHRALCQCLIVRASITMIQSAICYFNAFSVQLHLAINDRHTSQSFSVFSPWCFCNRPTVYTSAKRGCFVAVCHCL